jgi:hypothetical protein
LNFERSVTAMHNRLKSYKSRPLPNRLEFLGIDP